MGRYFKDGEKDITWGYCQSEVALTAHGWFGDGICSSNTDVKVDGKWCCKRHNYQLKNAVKNAVKLEAKFEAIRQGAEMAKLGIIG